MQNIMKSLKNGINQKTGDKSMRIIIENVK